MNFAKAQKEIVNELLKGNRHIKRFNIDEKHILVTTDGCKAYIFPVSTIVFSLEKIQEMKAVPVSEIVKDENELMLTPDFRLIDSFGSKMVRRLKGKGKNVYLNIKYLECFQNPKFFQDKSGLGAVIVAEGDKGAYTPVGLVMPVRGSWDDGTYYR